MYKRLKKYYTENGHSNVPQRYAKDKPVGNWVDHQRQKCIEEVQMDLLDAIQFDWDPNRTK